METIKRGLAMGSVREEETALAAGLMNFVRTISRVIATSLVATSWQDRTIELSPR
jgi:MFS transporter, DHA2 family, multidrug resistance protein